MLGRYVLILVVAFGFIAGVGGYVEYTFDFYPAHAADQ